MPCVSVPIATAINEERFSGLEYLEMKEKGRLNTDGPSDKPRSSTYRRTISVNHIDVLVRYGWLALQPHAFQFSSPPFCEVISKRFIPRSNRRQSLALTSSKNTLASPSRLNFAHASARAIAALRTLLPHRQALYKALAQHILLHFSRRSARQILDDLHTFGKLLLRQTGAIQKF